MTKGAIHTKTKYIIIKGYSQPGRRRRRRRDKEKVSSYAYLFWGEF